MSRKDTMNIVLALKDEKILLIEHVLSQLTYMQKRWYAE